MDFLLAGGAIPVALLGVIVPLWVVIAGASEHKQDRRVWWRVLAQVMWLGAAGAVIYITLWLANPQAGGVNLVPFASIERELARPSQSMAAFNLIGNLVMLVPFGLLARAAWRWGVLKTTLLGLVFSVGIETAQGLTGRSTDIDDVLLNTLGVFLAALLAGFIHLIGRMITRRPLRDRPGQRGSDSPEHSHNGYVAHTVARQRHDDPAFDHFWDDPDSWSEPDPTHDWYDEQPPAYAEDRDRRSA